MENIHFGDGLEKQLADALTKKGIAFVHESQRKGLWLDFYLPDFDVYVEVKRFHSDRVNRQLESKDNVVLLQGKKSIDLFKALISGA